MLTEIAIKFKLIEINTENTEMSEEMDVIIRKSSAKALPKLVSLFKNQL